MTPEEIERKASALREKMQKQFVCAPVHLIEVLQLIEALALALPRYVEPLDD